MIEEVVLDHEIVGIVEVGMTEEGMIVGMIEEMIEAASVMIVLLVKDLERKEKSSKVHQ
jgi:hypothetical protein